MGDGLPVKARLIQLIISGGDAPPLIKVSLYNSRKDYHYD
ncbi:hypothetical protein BCN_2169 [Bacillus cereus NC7401]|nr:hypothetical protein BCN_2169 [Bacillus cereus NC7401]